MRFEINALLEKATQITRTITSEEALKADREGIWLSETIAALKDTRLTSLVVPEIYGGTGHGMYILVSVCED